MRALLVGLSVLLLGAGAYGAWLLLELRMATAPASPTAFVQATWSVYRFGPGHRYHVGQLSLDCKACHQTQADGHFDRPGPPACAACHEGGTKIQHALVSVDAKGHHLDVNAAGAAGAERVSDCVACHGFGPDPEQKAGDCLSCHAHARGDTPAIVTHADVACQNCHDVHDNRVTPLKCGECHEIAAKHGHASATVEETCLTCHHAHGRAASALERCRDCHSVKPSSDTHASDNGSKIAATATFDGHTCTGCHAPHSFTKDSVTACTTCHSEVHALAGQGHATCTACHTPHAVRESVAQNVCIGCHTGVALEHSVKIDAHAACTSCHVAHPSAAQRGPSHAADTTACASCHQNVGHAGQNAHVGNMPCVSCHKPHGFKLAQGEQSCNGCHAAEVKLVQANAGHASCAGCHQGLPHGADLSPKTCTSCHAKVHAAQGHSQCTSCHEPHKGAASQKVCADCHAEEAHAGIHASRVLSCTQCHDQHQTTLLAGVADCKGCHAQAKLPGLHDVKEHAATCTSCHAPHGTGLPGARDTCLTCHEDRKEHQPEAKRCEGCHQFVSAPHPGSKSP